jgi:hypothetical protein
VIHESTVPVVGRLRIDYPHTWITREEAMYDMYPEWGPASHNPENPRSYEAVQQSLDLRDNGGQRPDDN